MNAHTALNCRSFFDSKMNYMGTVTLKRWQDINTAHLGMAWQDKDLTGEAMRARVELERSCNDETTNIAPGTSRLSDCRKHSTIWVLTS